MLGTTLTYVCSLPPSHLTPLAFFFDVGCLQYTMLSAVEMISGEEIDTQRERRWPSRSDATGVAGGPGVRVQFLQWEEESDISDTEGILGGWAKAKARNEAT